MVTPAIPITPNDEANELLVTDPFALLIGMLLDQQVPMEWAFLGPFTLRERLGHLDPAKIAAMPVDEFVDVCRDKPAIHRFPKSMGERIHAVSTHVVDHYDGDAERIWTEATDGSDLYRRLRDIPGYGDEKTKIFIAILGKRFGDAPAGWEEAAAPFSDDVARSVADVSSDETLLEVRAWKKAQKAKGKSKQE